VATASIHPREAVPSKAPVARTKHGDVDVARLNFEFASNGASHSSFLLLRLSIAENYGSTWIYLITLPMSFPDFQETGRRTITSECAASHIRNASAGEAIISK
jgi:hypothetical protein